MAQDSDKAAGATRRRLYVYNGGFRLKPRLQQIIKLAGWDITAGLPGKDDHVGIWGASPTAWRGRAVAARRGANLVTVEDAFIRSVLPGRAGGAIARRGPLGLLIDPVGLHFDASRPSLIETLVQSAKNYDLTAAAEYIDRIRRLDLSKYNAHRPQLTPPAAPGYVLVIDQTCNDASLMGAGRPRFLQMLTAARQENPGRRIVIRSHPETSAGLRPGHLTHADLREGEVFCDQPVSPWQLVENADRVYAVSSQLGYEALLAGHRPRLFGQPFYAGWGLSDDEAPVPRRGRASREMLFFASHILAPVWYDPCRDRLTDLNGAINQAEAEVRAYQQDRDGHLAYGMRLWKRPALARAFGNGRGVRFTSTPSDNVTLVWAGKADAAPGAIRVEDGFIRSRGLGAALTPPLSLVADDIGIYYDPRQESCLERLIAQPLTPADIRRAESLIAAIRMKRLTKYNLTGLAPDLPPKDGRRLILVPGQVEDDASVRLGAGAERTNKALLQRVRAENPDAILIYKPHPDVESGLRPGAIPQNELKDLADCILPNADLVTLFEHVDEVWTITSTLGFEALLRDIPVTVLGAPFYAGWGLTRDLGPVPKRRQARPGLAALVHACLIAYPRYFDPVSGLPCPVEVALERLTDPRIANNRSTIRLLARLQGAFSGHSWIWRR